MNEPGLESNLEPNVESTQATRQGSDTETGLEPRLETGLEPRLETGLEPRLETELEPRLETGLESGLEPCVVDDPAFSRAAAGAFFVCDVSGRQILAGADNLATLLGLNISGQDLPAELGIVDLGIWHELFTAKVGSGRTREDSVRYRTRAGMVRWLHLRYTSLPNRPDRLLVYAWDETSLTESQERLARAQAIDADSSARLQAAVLVDGPTVVSGSLEYASATMPSKLVDGDFMDVMQLEPGSIDIILGDVMGKGMEAAILGTVIKFGLFRSLATSLFGRPSLPTVSDICRSAEAAVTNHLEARSSIATFCYGRLHEAAMLYEFVDGGHTPLVHYRKATGDCRQVKGADMPFGFVDQQDFQAFMLPYRSGDILLVYSDGLSECPGSGGELFGETRVMYVVRSLANCATRDIVKRLIGLGFEYSAGGFADDVSLLCFKALEPAASDSAPGGRSAIEGSLWLNLRPGSSTATNALRKAIGKALAAVASCLASDEADRIILASHEALTNIAEHGLAGGMGRCLAQWRILGGVFSLELSYKGVDYDWLARPESPIEEYGEHGYGVSIIQAVMDSVLLCNGFGNERTLVLCRRLRCLVT
jgi:sigma-B regulation protein RsbU (phosphoserine phosphatase)